MQHDAKMAQNKPGGEQLGVLFENDAASEEARVSGTSEQRGDAGVTSEWALLSGTPE